VTLLVIHWSRRKRRGIVAGAPRLPGQRSSEREADSPTEICRASLANVAHQEPRGVASGAPRGPAPGGLPNGGRDC
jgi:hypothetical protein